MQGIAKWKVLEELAANVASLGRWWQVVGYRTYPDAKQFLISADSGGSNGYRLRLWKLELQRFADENQLEVTVCHLPLGQANGIRLSIGCSCYISMNWRGQPLTSHEVIVELIDATTTTTGLQVQAESGKRTYPTKVKVSDTELISVHVTSHMFHGEWNYTISLQKKL